MTKGLAVVHESSLPGGRVIGVALERRHSPHDASFDFIDPYQPAKLHGFAQLTLADDLGVGLEQADEFAHHMVVALEHPLLGLIDDTVDERHKLIEPLGYGFEHHGCVSENFETSLTQALPELARLSHHRPGQPDELEARSFGCRWRGRGSRRRQSG